MQPEILAYLAGIIDGEGTIFLQIDTRNNKNYRTWSVSVANTDKTLIDWLQSNFGGKVNSWANDRPRFGKKQLWRWYLGRKERILPLLSDILPYLIIKREKAEMAVKELSTVVSVK